MTEVIMYALENEAETHRLHFIGSFEVEDATDMDALEALADQHEPDELDFDAYVFVPRDGLRATHRRSEDRARIEQMSIPDAWIMESIGFRVGWAADRGKV